MNKTVAAFYRGKTFAWILALLIISLPVIFMHDMGSRAKSPAIWTTAAFWRYLVFFVLVWLWHTNQLLPALMVRKEYASYVIAIVIMFAAAIVLRPYDKMIAVNRSNPATEQPKMPPPRMNDSGRPPAPGAMPMPPDNAPLLDIISIFLLLILLAAGLALALAKYHAEAQQKAAAAEAGRSRAELDFLKARLHPHFLFNTLNNLYVLASQQHQATASSILQLSNIMRYITDDAGDDQVPFDKELQCINDYISLQQLRLGSKTDLQYNTNIYSHNDVIAPLMLLPLVENVFTHGITSRFAHQVVISISLKDHQFHMHTSNPYLPKDEAKRKGIGLQNTLKRLELLYNGRYQFKSHIENDKFITDLQLQLHEKA